MTEGFETALKTALDMLRASDKFRTEIEERLIAKDFADSTIAEVFAWLDSKGLANDAKTLQAVVVSLLNEKLLGEETAKARLRQRGAPDELVEGYFASRSDEDERESIRAFIARKLRGASSRNSIGRALQSRGFREELVIGELDRHFGEDAPDESDAWAE